MFDIGLEQPWKRGGKDLKAVNAENGKLFHFFMKKIRKKDGTIGANIACSSNRHRTLSRGGLADAAASKVVGLWRSGQ